MSFLSGRHTYYITKSISIEGEVKGDYALEVVFVDQEGINISANLSILEGSSASLSFRGISLAGTNISSTCTLSRESSGSSVSIEQACFPAGGKVCFYPAIELQNSSAKASHSAYLYSFDEQELFYLMSRGLKREEAKLALLLSFLKVAENHPFRATVESVLAQNSKKFE